MRDHVEDHWQTLPARRLTETGRTVCTVPPLTGNRLSRDAHVAELVEGIAQTTGPLLRVAHSAGCLTTVQWARRHNADVRGALLAAPPDFDTHLPAGAARHRGPPHGPAGAPAVDVPAATRSSRRERPVVSDRHTAAGPSPGRS
ncbi:alpha/beta hydrolase [Streptomyces sp. NPDC008122]|uniref:RBBP9/YdeN family alpha/beta hydrolase n=1 Tax=Streptomyces sp. NPDC008122 TaxID=3364810 RepID=UPI0036E117F1